ncbi:hypothetical protein ATI61_101858 [Archangium gephyra]|uniref:Phosphopantetheine adenylyltransferase n=1 Tax=Archangium gephyra TaxID=48 RepID=A0AAC8TFG7_9BACT|nr:hypothetical protein [Archangium gephyra]AKJ04047.1 Hypothetical protein AA314_05673 [Archangium gephyra]REG37871.1 hypothetical protein ATI61_101858 [Archangium gephyra]
MQIVVSASLVIAAVIHLLPLTGVVSAKALAQLYGLPFEESNLQILMRHRAVLFGLLGVFLMIAAFTPRLQTLAFAAGLISAGSFLWIAFAVGGYNALLQRVVVADIIAVACLLVGAGVRLFQARGSVPP